MREGGRIRLLLYIPDLQMGGAERTVVRLARHLDPSRFEIHVAWSGVWGMAGDILKELGIPLHLLQLDLADQAQAIQFYRELRPDVYLSFAYRSGHLDLMAARSAGIEAILTRRADIRHWDAAKKSTEADWKKNSATKLVIACSEAAGWVCNNVERVPWSRIRVIHNGVDLPDLPAERPGTRSDNATIRRELGLPPQVRLIGNTANYRTLKGYETLLHAFRRVVREYPAVHFVACGTAVEAGHIDKLRVLVKKLGLVDKVSLLPERTDLAAVYSGLDLFVQSSVTEGLSNSLLEAMSWGVPVVATSVGGTPEAVTDSVCGRLIPHSDEKAMAQAILEPLCNPHLLARWGREARSRIEDSFTVPRMMAGYEAAFEAVLRELEHSN